MEIFEVGLNKQLMPNICDTLFAELWKKKSIMEWNKYDSNPESIKTHFFMQMTMELLNNVTVYMSLRQNGSRNSNAFFV